MKKIFLIINVICFIVMTSCTDDSMDMGKVTYHPSFWFLSSADTVPLVKTFEFDFSNDARANKDIYAEFQFVDNDGKPISPKDMMVYVDGQLLADNSFRVTSADSVKEIKYIFPSTAESGKHQGYLKLKNHNLHRLDNQQLTPGQPVDVLQWTIYFDKRMNPLAFVLLCILIVFSVCLLLWFLILRRMAFPVIKLSRVDIKETSENKRINRCRKVVFCSKKKKQSTLSKVFTGKILYIPNSIWTNDWELKPGKERRTVKPMLHGNYAMHPMKVNLKSMDEISLTNIQNKSVIHLKLY